MKMLLEILRKGTVLSIASIFVFSLAMELVKRSSVLHGNDKSYSYQKSWIQESLQNVKKIELSKFINVKPMPIFRPKMRIQEIKSPNEIASKNTVQSMRTYSPNTNYIEINGKRKYWDEL